MDNTPRMLFWEIDEFILMAAPFFLGVAVGSVSVMLSGIVLKKFYSRWKKRCPRGVLRHTIYWNIPTHSLRVLGIFKRLPDSHERNFIV